MLDSTAYLLLCRPELVVDRELLERYERLLDATEKARFHNFRIERDAHTFLVAHALLRTALSHFAGIQPDAWRFRFNAFGRPEVECDGPAPKFNLSHSRGLVACLLTPHGYCGVDVEEVRDRGDARAIADHFFAPPEAQAMKRLPKKQHLERFYSLWTLKEAYAKARGMGLSLPLNSTSFKFDGDRISFHSASTQDYFHEWSFTLLRPLPSHLVATAVQDKANVVAVRWFTPLAGIEAAQNLRPIAFSKALAIP